MAELEGLEKEKCASLDRVSHAFASVMEEIFGWRMEMNSPIGSGRLGYLLGKWIYLMDLGRILGKTASRGLQPSALPLFLGRG